MLSKFNFKFPYQIDLKEPFKIIIINAIKKIFDKLINKKSDKDLSDKEQLNVDNIENIKNYNELLNEFNKQIEKNIYSLEDKILMECTQYYEELILLVNEFENIKGINLQRNKLESLITRFKLEIKRNLGSSIYRKFSLDNIELKSILGLPPGQVKKQKIQIFKENLIKQILQDFTKDIKISISDLNDIISQQLIMLISDIKKNNENLLNELTLLETTKNDKKNIADIVSVAEEKKILCNKIINILRV